MTVRYVRGAWWAFAAKGKTRRSRRCRSEAEARAAEAQLNRELAIAAGEPAKDTLAHLLRVCSQLDWRGRTDAVLINARYVVRLMGAMPVGEITMAVLDQFVADQLAQGVGSSKIRCRLSALKVMMLRAQRLGLLSQLPLFPEPRTLPLPEARDLVLPDPWVEALLSHLQRAEEREAVRIVTVLLEQGLRISEAFSLSWDRVDLDRGQVLIAGTKGKTARRLPLTDQAWATLRAQQQTSTGPAVFNQRQRTFSRAYAIARDAACQELGLGPAVRNEWVVHTLRHTNLTRLAEQGWSAPQLKAWAGHGSLLVTQRYIHTSAINLEALVRR